MEKFVRYKLNELLIRVMLALEDDEAEDGSLILRWSGIDEDREPVTIELYADGFLDIWRISPRSGSKEDIFSDWLDTKGE